MSTAWIAGIVVGLVMIGLTYIRSRTSRVAPTRQIRPQFKGDRKRPHFRRKR